MIYAGVTGIPPENYTLRELYTAYVSRCFFEESRFARVISTISAFGGKPLDPNDINAYYDEYISMIGGKKKTTDATILPSELKGIIERGLILEPGASVCRNLPM